MKKLKSLVVIVALATLPMTGCFAINKTLDIAGTLAGGGSGTCVKDTARSGKSSDKASVSHQGNTTKYSRQQKSSSRSTSVTTCR